MSTDNGPLNLYIVAGEKSGDDLGGKLMDALRAQNPAIRFYGVGGEAMAVRGLNSLFPLSDIAVMGIGPVLARLPSLIARVYRTVADIGRIQPACLVIIDSPDFTHAVARRVRKRWPHIVIIDYVCPSIWAWRSGRARKMRGYIDHVLALLPFEPDALKRLSGPACAYVGHPLTQRLDELRPDAAEQAQRGTDHPEILVLPGSRRSEISHLMDDFGAAVAQLARHFPAAIFVLPAVPHVAALIEQKIASWPVKPKVLHGEAAKYAAFRRARAALAASGTVTLELALAQVPMVVAYKVGWIETPLRYFIKVAFFVLPNLILGKNAVPEYLQERCTPDALSAAVAHIVPDGAARTAQLEAFTQLDKQMYIPDERPADMAARIVIHYATRRQTDKI